MATVALPQTKPIKLRPSRQYDNYFFSAMALLILITVFVGFARTYFLAGVFRAPLPSLIIHIHGAVFSIWIFLLIVLYLDSLIIKLLRGFGFMRTMPDSRAQSLLICTMTTVFALELIRAGSWPRFLGVIWIAAVALN